MNANPATTSGSDVNRSITIKRIEKNLMGFRPKEINFEIEGDPYTLRIDHFFWKKQNSILPTYKTKYILISNNHGCKKLEATYPHSFRYCIEAVIGQILVGLKSIFKFKTNKRIRKRL